MIRVLLVIALVLVAAAPAAASTRNDIYRDCEDSQLQGDYTREEIRDALKNMPSDLAAYSDCEDVLERYEFGDGLIDQPPAGAPSTGSGGPRPGEPTPTPTPPNVPETPADQAAIDAAPAVARQPVTIGDRTVLAGVSPFRDGRPGNTLPTALVIALVLLGLTGAALVARPLQRALGRS